MFKCCLIMLLVCFANTAHAKAIENADALKILQETTIAGIGLNSSVEDIKDALSDDKIPMKCNYTERTSRPSMQNATAAKKGIFYQNWDCRYVSSTANQMKHKLLQVRAVNGTVTFILYRGNMATSLDEENMFSYYRDVDKELLAAGLAHDHYSFIFKEIGPDVSPTLTQQNLDVRLLRQCADGPTVVSLRGELTEMTVPNSFSITVKYQQKACN